MRRTLEVLNELEKESVFSRYAIGGAMAATFYTEPFLTFDLDVFVVLPRTPGGLLTLAPLYDALRTRGYSEEAECVMIEGVPVQFLPAYNTLVEEALNEAQEIMYEDVPARVLRSEHLLASQHASRHIFVHELLRFIERFLNQGVVGGEKLYRHAFDHYALCFLGIAAGAQRIIQRSERKQT